MSSHTDKAQTDLSCRVIQNLTAWQQLSAVWDSVLRQSPEYTPWQSFDFLTSWWMHLSEKMRLRILVVERVGQPCLIMPLQISNGIRIPGMPIRMLEPISMIMDVNRPRLAIGAFDPQAYECAFDTLWNLRHEWDLLRVDEKEWNDQEVTFLRDHALKRTWIFRQTFSHLVPYLNLQQDWSQFLQSRSQKMRKNLKAARKKLESIGTLQLQVCETHADIAAGFETFLQLHTRSWKQKRQIEHSKSPGQKAFFARWLVAAAAREACKILVLTCNHRPVAATIAFTEGGTYYSAQIVHDQEFAPCSPGTLLEAMELELLMREQRYARYEFLGSFLSNKMRWSDTASNTSIVVVFQRSIRTFLMDAYFYTLKPYLRPLVLKILDKIRPSKK
jgi:CelD/BcsL family acetyltransferase involved in cellulose biosynthesis